MIRDGVAVICLFSLYALASVRRLAALGWFGYIFEEKKRTEAKSFFFSALLFCRGFPHPTTQAEEKNVNRKKERGKKKRTRGRRHESKREEFGKLASDSLTSTRPSSTAFVCVHVVTAKGRREDGQRSVELSSSRGLVAWCVF